MGAERAGDRRLEGAVADRERPCQLGEGIRLNDLSFDGNETFDIPDLDDSVTLRKRLTLVVHRSDGSRWQVPMVLRLDTPVEIDYVRSGGTMKSLCSACAAPESSRMHDMGAVSAGTTASGRLWTMSYPSNARVVPYAPAEPG